MRFLSISLQPTLLAAIAAILFVAPNGWSQDTHAKHDTDMKASSDMKHEERGMKEGSAAKASGTVKVSHSDAYPLDVCVVSGEKLGEDGKPVVKEYDGREVQFCCNDCPKQFEADKATYIKKLDDAIVAAQKANYPLDTCVVSGEKLGGEMGDPVDYVYKNRLIRFCCKNCVKDFEKDPATYLSKIDQAVVENQKSTYPLETCVVSGEKLGGEMGEPLYYVYNDQLVEFCCPACKKDFDKEPAKYMAKLNAAKGGEGSREAMGSEAKHHDKDADAGGHMEHKGMDMDSKPHHGSESKSQ